MYTTTALILAFSAFSAALPSLSPKEATCYTPTGFQVNGFSIFVPAAGNPNPESIYFYLADYATDTGTTCDSTTIPTTTPNKCTNANFEYLWTGGTSGGTLTIGETYTPCSNSTATAQIFGDVSLGLDCIPSEPPEPNGYGSQCEVPVNAVSGEFTRTTLYA